MNLNELRYAIESSFVGCRTCNEPIDTWMEGDPSERGHKVLYHAQIAAFGGACQNGHINEFYLAEVKAEEIIAHDITERVLGEYKSQEDCPHRKRQPQVLGEGEAVPSPTGIIEGPAKIIMCYACGRRDRAAEPKRSHSGIIGLDGRPIGSSADDSE